MTLPYSGTISLGQVNAELNRPHTQQINLNSSTPRSLAGKLSGTISMSDLYGKSRVNYFYFTSTGLFTVPSGITAIDFCLVAGGGGAGLNNNSNEGGGGGGGGGVIWGINVSVIPGELIGFTIGSGGTVNNNGQDSSLNIASQALYTARGGGTGGWYIRDVGDDSSSYYKDGASGGSCGGNQGQNGSSLFHNPTIPPMIAQGSRGGVYPTFGNIGGNSWENHHSGGGGGAGGSASDYLPGPGVYYNGVYVGAGGPGGRRWVDADPALGGYGAGGRGGYTPSPGTSGICIISYNYN